MAQGYSLINTPIDNDDLLLEDDRDESPLLNGNSNDLNSAKNKVERGLFNESSNSTYHCHAETVIFQDGKSWKKLLCASLLCFLFMFVEFVGGYIAGSSAVMSDAAHLLSDFIGFMISLISIAFSRKAASKHMTFGYHRMEVLGAFISVFIVWVLAITFIVVASKRLLNQNFSIEADTMIMLASFGIVVNICMGIILNGVCFKNNHSHGLRLVTNDSSENINVKAAAVHVLGDLIQSFGVLIAAIIIKYYPNAKIADPICTLLFAILVLFSTVCVAKDAFWLLLEGNVKNSSDLITELLNIPHVRHLHNFHMWTISPGKDVVNVHLAVDSDCDRDLVLSQATNKIQNFSYILSCTVQIEPFDFDLVSSCEHCKSKYS